MRQFVLRSLCMLLLVTLLNTAQTSHGQQESDQLPTDIVFVARRGDPNVDANDLPSNILARIDAKTLTVNEFYTDENVHWLIPISWSPQGDKLAVFREHLGNQMQTCIIVGVPGKLKSCFEGGIPGPSMEDPLLKATWSEDGKKVYFIVERNGHRELVAGNPDTGQIIQSIYKYDKTLAGYNNITWSSSARFIVQDMSNYPEPATLVDMKTGSHLVLDSIVPTGQGGICDFSPKDTYLVAIHYEQNLEELIVLNRNGTIVRRIRSDNDKLNPLRFDRRSCPTWSSDETTFYFYAEDRSTPDSYLYKYSFSNDQMTQIVLDKYISLPFALSPQGTHLAMSSPDGEQIRILFPDGHLEYVGASFRTAQYPLWVPQSQ